MKAIHALPLALAAIASQVIAQEMPEFKPLSLEQIRANIAAQQAKERPTNPPPIIVPSSTNENTADRMRREHAEKQAAQQRELDPRLEDIRKAFRSSITVPLTVPGSGEVRPHPTKPNVVLVPTWMIDYQPPPLKPLGESPLQKYEREQREAKARLYTTKQVYDAMDSVLAYPRGQKLTRQQWSKQYGDLLRLGSNLYNNGRITLKDYLTWNDVAKDHLQDTHGHSIPERPQQSAIEMQLEHIQRSLDRIEDNQ